MPREMTAEAPDEFTEELKPGTKLLQGQYTIVRYIAAGGFGITYLAKNGLDRDVVIKECFPGSFCRRSRFMVGARSRAHESEFGQIVRLFVQEAKSLSRLIHPNIVGVHQVFEENNTAYMAIDYVNGHDLQKIIDTDRTSLQPSMVMMMLRKLLGAVAFIHEHGMLHRDISPDNILIDHRGEPILIDFGAARQQATRIGGRALSALRVVKDGYSPQEFYIGGVTQSGASDLYSLAATFYHLITGEVPPNSQARLVRLAESGADPYRPIAGLAEGYPAAFLEAIDAALKVLPKERIQTAREWLARISTHPEINVIPLGGPRGLAPPIPSILQPAPDAPLQAAPAAAPAAAAQIAPGAPGRRDSRGGPSKMMLLGVALLVLAAIIYVVFGSARAAAAMTEPAGAVPVSAPAAGALLPPPSE